MGSSASLDRSPKKNWVENSGELPAYVREIARSIEKSGKTLSSAISIAISRIKVWAAGGDNVTPKTQAKASKALAEWNALKSRNKARKTVKATWVDLVDAASETVVLTVAEDRAIRFSLEDGYDNGAVALSRVVEAASQRS